MFHYLLQSNKQQQSAGISFWRLEFAIWLYWELHFLSCLSSCSFHHYPHITIIMTKFKKKRYLKPQRKSSTSSGAVTQMISAGSSLITQPGCDHWALGVLHLLSPLGGNIDPRWGTKHEANFLECLKRVYKGLMGDEGRFGRDWFG